MKIDKTFFKETFAAFFNEAKIFSRKNWTEILGVSNVAISNWTTGKNLPSGEIIQDIIMATRQQHLNTFQQKKFDEFIASLEQVLEKTDENENRLDRINRLTDFALKDLEEDAISSIRYLWYDARCEMYNQNLRESEVIRTIAQLKLEMSPDENKTFHSKALALDRLVEYYKDPKKQRTFFLFSKTLKAIHLSYISEMKRALENCDFNSEEEIMFSCRIEPIINSFKVKGENDKMDGRTATPTSDVSLFKNPNSLKSHGPSIDYWFRFRTPCTNRTIQKKFWNRDIILEKCLERDNELIFDGIKKSKNEFMQAKFIRLIPDRINSINIEGNGLFFAIDPEGTYEVNKRKKNNLIVLNGRNLDKEFTGIKARVNRESYALVIDSNIISEKINELDVIVKSNGGVVFTKPTKKGKSILHGFYTGNWLEPHYLITPEQTKGIFSVEIIRLPDLHIVPKQFFCEPFGSAILLSLNHDMNSYFLKNNFDNTETSRLDTLKESSETDTDFIISCPVPGHKDLGWSDEFNLCNRGLQSGIDSISKPVSKPTIVLLVRQYLVEQNKDLFRVDFNSNELMPL